MRIRKLSCSFCGKAEDEVATLVAGPNVYICDECVAVITKIMEETPPRDNQPRVPDEQD